MAITICTTVSKKIPDPHTQYANNQASITITAEITDLGQVHTEAARLYTLAERAVDQQLRIETRASAPTTTASSAVATPTLTFENGNPPRQSPAAGQPRSYPRTGARRAPAPVTESQLRLINMLIDKTGASREAIVQQYRIADLRELGCKDGSAVIDALKQGTAA